MEKVEQTLEVLADVRDRFMVPTAQMSEAASHAIAIIKEAQGFVERYEVYAEIDANALPGAPARQEAFDHAVEAYQALFSLLSTERTKEA